MSLFSGGTSATADPGAPSTGDFWSGIFKTAAQAYVATRPQAQSQNPGGPNMSAGTGKSANDMSKYKGLIMAAGVLLIIILAFKFLKR